MAEKIGRIINNSVSFVEIWYLVHYGSAEAVVWLVKSTSGQFHDGGCGLPNFAQIW